MSKSLGDRRFADARFADKHRIIFAFTRKNADNAADLGIAADDRVELLFTRAFHQIRTVLGKNIVGVFGVIARDRRRFHLGKLIGESLFCNAVFGTNILYGRIALRQKSEEKVFDRDIFVLHAACGFFSKAQHCGNFAGRIKVVVCTGNFRQTVNGCVKLA